MTIAETVHKLNRTTPGLVFLVDAVPDEQRIKCSIVAANLVPIDHPRSWDHTVAVLGFLLVESMVREEEGKCCDIEYMTRRGGIYYRLILRHENTHPAVS